jgi:hypothetical protein
MYIKLTGKVPIWVLDVKITSLYNAGYHFSGSNDGSLVIAAEMTEFGGESVRTHALTTKFGIIPRLILKNPKDYKIEEPMRR